MKTRIPWMALAIGAVLALGVSTYLMAQPDIAGPGAANGPGGRGGRQGGMPQQMPPAVMASGATSLYVMAGGTLLKYDAVTLKELGKVELVAPPAADPAAGAAGGGRPGAAGGRPGGAAGGPGAAAGGPGAPGGPGGRGGMNRQRPMAGAMLITPGANEQVLVVIGDQFFRLEAATLTVKAKATLPAPELPNANPPMDPGAPDAAGPPEGPGGPGGPGGMGGGRPAELSLKGVTLYVLRGPQIVAVNTVDGKVTGTAMLPMPVPPAPPAPPAG
jgi:hypothetical protein